MSAWMKKSVLRNSVTVGGDCYQDHRVIIYNSNNNNNAWGKKMQSVSLIPECHRLSRSRSTNNNKNNVVVNQGCSSAAPNSTDTLPPLSNLHWEYSVFANCLGGVLKLKRDFIATCERRHVMNLPWLAACWSICEETRECRREYVDTNGDERQRESSQPFASRASGGVAESWLHPVKARSWFQSW